MCDVACGSFLFDLFSAVCMHGEDGIFPEERVAFFLNSVPVPDPGQRVAMSCFAGMLTDNGTTCLFEVAACCARSGLLRATTSLS